MDRKFEFGHERLDCYRLAVSVARWAAKQHIPAERRHLRDQLLRAADSVPANVAEGSGYEPGVQRRHHYRIALGSAAEACSVLDVVDLPGGPDRQEELRRTPKASRRGRREHCERTAGQARRRPCSPPPEAAARPRP